jgi:hypothetical protein
MKEFLLVFRTDYISTPEATAEQMKAMTQQWIDWMTNMKQQDKLVTNGKRLHNTGMVVKPNLVTNGPYTDIKESIGGFSIIQAASYEEAAELAKGCPILTIGGNVEVREILQM